MARKVHYFEINGLAESLRYILHYGGHKFEDIRYKHKDWPVEEIKKLLPFGQLPLFEEGDRRLNQSNAIARYLARKSNLLPSDHWEQAVLDAAVLNFSDFFVNLKTYIVEKDRTKKLEIKKKLIDETINFFFSVFERDLQNNNGHFGKKLSWADFVYVGIIECTNLFLDIKLEENYPATRKLMDTIHALPGVKEYIAKRGPYELPLSLR